MSWYDTDWLSNNLRTVVNSVILNMEQSAYDSSESKFHSYCFNNVEKSVPGITFFAFIAICPLFL